MLYRLAAALSTIICENSCNLWPIKKSISEFVAKKILFEPFKKVRKERQSPAHKINSNFYDKTLVEKQKEIISQCYQAMKNLRHIFKDHRKAKDVKTPEWLDNGEIKTF